MRIAYGAGHGGFGVTPGKRSPAGEYEWDFNNEVAVAFAKEMKNYNVKLMRTDDPTGKTDVLLKTRTDEANNWGADLYISFHHNAFQSKWGNHGGTETFYHAGSADGKKLAQLVQNAQLKAYGLRDRGIKTDNLHITRETRMVAVLCEGGFMDSNTDIKKLRDKKVLQTAGKEIAHAVAEYLGLKKGSGSTASKPSKPSNPSKPSTPKPTGKLGLVDWMKSKKMDSSFANRKKLAGQHGIKNYTGTASQNTTLLAKLQSGSKPSKPNPSKPKPSTGDIKAGSKVKIKSNAGNYSRTTTTIPTKHKNKLYTIQQVGKDDVLIKELYSWVKKSDLVGQTSTSTSTSKSKTLKSGSRVKIKSSAGKYSRANVTIPAKHKNKTYTVQQVGKNDVLIKELYSWVRKVDVQ